MAYADVDANKNMHEIHWTSVDTNWFKQRVKETLSIKDEKAMLNQGLDPSKSNLEQYNCLFQCRFTLHHNYGNMFLQKIINIIDLSSFLYLFFQ